MQHRDSLTYRYKRTLLEAFGCDASSAVAITRHRRPLAYLVADYLAAVVIAAGLLAFLLHSLGAL